MTTRKTETRPTTHNRAGRPDRIPLSGARDILTIEGRDDNFVYRWLNDVDDRLQRAEAGGWEFVSHDVKVGQNKVDSAEGIGGNVSKSVGGGRIAYLMRIRKDWYEEDQAAKQEKINRAEEDMMRELNSKKDGKYGSVKLK